MAPTAILPAPVPPTVVGPSTKRATRPTKKLPEFLFDGVRNLEKVHFDSSKHVNFQPPERIYSMQEIGLEGHGASPTAVTEPFPLFTKEAIEQMRSEIFSLEVLEHCQYASTFLIARISEIAGIDLIPSLDYEVANINISVPDSRQGIVGGKDDDLPAFAWHFDSFPFVCVTMLSDCTGMIGGETALKTATGDIMKVRGPTMGTAVVMQGRYIEHQALKALGGRERISMVTCFRPKSPFIKDETILTGVRGISNLSELYSQYTIYRMELMIERLRARLTTERERGSKNQAFDTPGIRNFLVEQTQFLNSMLAELIEV